MGINIDRWSGDHSGESKSYHLMLLVNSDTDNAVLIKRWGRKGKFGTFDVSRGSHRDMRGEFNRTQNAKVRRRYVGSVDTKVAISESELEGTLKLYWKKIGKSNIRHLAPHVSVDGILTEECWAGAQVMQRADIRNERSASAPPPPSAAESYANVDGFGDW